MTQQSQQSSSVPVSAEIHLSVSATAARIGATDQKQRQITVTTPQGATPIGASKAAPKMVSCKIKGKDFSLIMGDTHGIHSSHQSAETSGSFDALFNALTKVADKRVAAQASIEPYKGGIEKRKKGKKGGSTSPADDLDI